MITFIILTIITLMLAAAATIILGIGGTAFLIVFGDVIVCILIIIWIVKKLIKK